MTTQEYPVPDELADDTGEWIAAQARHLIRAWKVSDTKGVEVSLFYLRDFLVKTLVKYLARQPRWDSNGRWIDGLNGSLPTIVHSDRVVIRDDIIWATMPDQSVWYREPFAFDLVLDPLTGNFLRFTIQFSDFRSLVEKNLSVSSGEVLSERNSDDNAWAFTFRCEGQSR